MTLKRVIQSASFIIFLVLLWFATFPLVLPVPVDVYLMMDPLAGIATIISSREFVWTLMPGMVTIVLTVFFGRFFCSLVCPLGTSIDVSDKLAGGPRVSARKNISPLRHLKIIKYLVLCFILGAALLKVSLAVYGAPIPIITRFAGLFIYPVYTLAADAGLAVIRPLADRIGLTSLAYANLPNPSFALEWFIIGLPACIFALALWTPRFWCRYLCPAGAVFALASLRPLVLRRRVSDRCTSCGLCRKKCPMDAIAEDPHGTDFSECILCRRCTDVCPEDAVRFAPGPGALQLRTIRFSAQRRVLILSALAGLGTALASLAGLKGRACEGGPGRIMEPALIRPPGAIQECSFLEKCIGCGECMKTCPTNTLQPAGLAAGFAGFFGPVMVPRRGPCDPTCNACGHVCPTKAIRPLSLDEKRYAKVGTASIVKRKCLAWEYGKACLVCVEVCPYGAISLKRVSDIAVAVPVMEENKCSGCGFCEYYCPVQAKAAIVVEPMDALRLNEGSYRSKSSQLGISIEPKQGQNPEKGLPGVPPEGQLPPGFSE
ncbi:MAG TPA: 4Fe-4S binding protein [Desulfomonilia bacterium]|nr:4Fe-4S binding protein [Desulfomonilia bacterium]